MLGGEQGIDSSLGVGLRDAVALVFRLCGAEAIVVGRNGDETQQREVSLLRQVPLRRTLVGTVDGVVVVEQQSLGVDAVFHLVAYGDGAGEHHGVAVGVLRGVDEVVGSEVLVRVIG